MSKAYYIILLIFFYLTQFTKSESLNDEDIKFLLYPSESYEESYGFHIYNYKSEDIFINSTEGENMKKVRTTKTKDAPIINLSSVMIYDNSLLVKTCFGPNKIIEIIGANKETFIPENPYFNNTKNNLENIKYCYTTAIYNPEKITQYVIITYWTEAVVENGVETYAHKSILFYPDKKKFSDIINIKTNKEEKFCAQSCTNQRNLYIYCNINPSLSSVENKHILIDPMYISLKQIKIKLVSVASILSSSIYHKPIGLMKSIYTDVGKRAEFFLTEYHDKSRNITRLATSLYINSDNRTLILRFEDYKVDHGINIEDVFIEPNLFNILVPNIEELIVIYIMKGKTGENLLLLNRIDYEKSLKVRTKLDKYSFNNYLREGICKNPQYIQSMYIKSYINYEDKDKEIIKNNPNIYHKYQKDIAAVISCKNETNQIEYQYLKITMPQVLSNLGKINEIDNSFKFNNETIKIILDIYNNPNLKSLRNVEIIFGESDYYNRIFVIQAVNNGERSMPINKTTSIIGAEFLEISRTLNFQKNKIYRIPYRTRQTEEKGNTIACHLTSDWGYFEFSYEMKESEPLPVCDISSIPYCKDVSQSSCTCEKCYDNKIDGDQYIIGLLSLDKETKECICDVENGFKRYPKDEIKMCVCEDNYSFYNDIYMCLPDTILNNGSYCIKDQDENSKIYIYEDLKGRKINMTDGLPRCPIVNKYEPAIWFPMGDNSFYYVKLEFNDCVFIVHKKTNKLIMYYDREHCKYNDDFDYSQYLNVYFKSEDEYNAYLDEAVEFQPFNQNFSLIRDDLDINITFFVQNNYITQLYPNLSTIEISEGCLEKITPSQHHNITKFIANIKRNDTPATQVEYQIYNSLQIENNLNLSLCLNEDQNNKRRLENDDGNYSKSENITIYVNIDWDERDNNSIYELYNDNGIFLFNSSDDFYNDVCYKYKTRKGHDIYLENRKKQYYIDKPLRESNCMMVGYNNITDKIVCNCSIKTTPDYYYNITFSYNEKSEEFKKFYAFPNLGVIQCILDAEPGRNPFNYILLILIIIFVFSYKYYRKWRKSKSKEKDQEKKLEYDDEFENLFKELKKKEGEEIGIDNNNNDDDDDDDDGGEFRLNGNEENSSKVKDNNDTNNIVNDVKEEIQEIKNSPQKDFESESNGDNNKDNIGLIDIDSNRDKDDNKSDNNTLVDNKEEIDNKSEDKKENGDLIDKEEDKGKENLIDVGKKDDNDINKGDNKDDNNIGEIPSEDKKSNEVLNLSQKKESTNVYKSIVFNSIIDKNDPPKIDSNKYDDDSVSDPKFPANPPKGKKGGGKKDRDKQSETSKNSSNKTGIMKRGYSRDDKESNSEVEPKVYYEQNKGGTSSRMINGKKSKSKKSIKNKKNKNETNIIRENIQNQPQQEEYDDFTKDMFVYFEDYIKNDKRSFCQMFYSIIKYNSTIFFILDICNICNQNSKNDNFTIIAIIILSINLFIFYNIATEFDLSTLHYFYHTDDNLDTNGITKFLFFLVICLYIPIYFLKYWLSRREFLWHAKRKIDMILTGNAQSKSRIVINLHTIKSQVNIYKNKKEKYAENIYKWGTIFLLFNLYLVACFLGIYNNSYWCLILNVLVTMAILFVFMLGVFFLSALLRCCSRVNPDDYDNNQNDDNDNDLDEEHQKKCCDCFQELCTYNWRYIFYKISQLLNPAYYIYKESKIDDEFKLDGKKYKNYTKKYKKKVK